MNKHPSVRSSFRQSAKSFIEHESLDEAQLLKFEQLLSGEDIELSNGSASTQQGVKELQASDSLKPEPNFRAWYVMSAFAASLVLVFMLSINFYPKAADLSQQIANEVAMNHIKMKPLELKADSMPPLREYFTELDFSVVSSSILSTQHNTMLGGRYCSIQGVTAAQLRYQTEAGNKVTLYEVGYDLQRYGKLPRIEQGEQPLSIDVKGINVQLWVEKGLLMAQVQNID